MADALTRNDLQEELTLVRQDFRDEMDRWTAKLFQYLDKRFDEVNKRIDGLDEKYDRLTTTLDAFLKRLDDIEKDNTCAGCATRPL